MAGKRKSTTPGDGNGDGREAIRGQTIRVQTHQPADVSHSPTDANVNLPPKLDRRREMADIARRRAAHFATWDDSTVGAEDEDGNGNGNGGENPHTGGSAARTLGPWSTAVELANARERQRAKREEGMITASRAATEQLGATPMGSIPPWTPSRSPLLGRRPMSQVPLLSAACLRLVVDLLEDVETLWGLPDVVKTRIAIEACRRRALSPSTVRLFVQDSPTELCLPNCTALEPEHLVEALLEVATPKLGRLELGLCGRALTDEVAKRVSSEAPKLSNLRFFKCSGAYRLGDDGLSDLLFAMPRLEELCLAQCSRLEGASLRSSIPRLTTLRHLDLSGCRGIGGEVLCDIISSASNSLEVLVLDGIMEVNDPVMETIARTTSRSLQTLSLKNCRGVTEYNMEHLKSMTCLVSLALDECPITQSVLSSLAAHLTPLHHLSLKRCGRLRDAWVIPLVVKGALCSLNLNACTNITDATLEALTQNCAATLESLDVSWCRKLSYQGLGRMVDRCARLERLEVWGCTQLGDEFLNGHSNDLVKVVGRGEVLLPVL